MLNISLRRIKLVVVLDLSGSIDIDSSNLIEVVAGCLEKGYLDLLCNFENVNLLDYAGLSVLSIAYKNVLNHKSRVKFVNIPAHIRKIFLLVGLEMVFEIYEDEEFALRSFEEDRIIAEIQKKQLRRRFKRLPVDIDIEFKSRFKEEQFNPGKVLNISAVGVLVFAEKTYPLGEILKIRILLSPAPGLLELETKVIWVVQKELQPQIYPGMGLEFYHTESETQKKIVEFVDRNLPLGSMSDLP